MGTIKDRDGMDLTDAEDIEKRCQECTELYKKYLHDPDNHNDVITRLKPLILECKVKWTLGSITTNKASGGDEIPVELFQILKDDAISAKSAALNTPANLENSAVAEDWKRSVFIPIPKKGTAKKCSNYLTIALFSHTTKIMQSSHRQKKVLHLCVQGHSVMSNSLQPCRLWHARFLYQRVSPQGKDIGVAIPSQYWLPYPSRTLYFLLL